MRPAKHKNKFTKEDKLVFTACWMIVAIIFFGFSVVYAQSLDSTIFNTQSTYDMTYNDEQNVDANYGGHTTADLDDNFFATHIFIRITSLDDVLGASSSGLDYDSVVIFITMGLNSLDDNGEELLVTGYPVTQVWTEGFGPVNSNDLTWNNYTTATAWTLAGGDKGSAFSNFGATGTMVINFDAPKADDTMRFYVDTGYFRTMVEDDNTKGWMYIATHQTGTPNDAVIFYSEAASPTARRPYLVAYHTDKVAGEDVSTRRRKVLMTGGK